MVCALSSMSMVSSATSTSVGWRKPPASATARVSRSLTIRAIRSSSAVASSMERARSSGVEDSSSSSCPRTTVMGVRSSCPASSTNCR